MASFQHLRDRLTAFARSPRGRRLVKGGRVLFIGGVVALLLYQLTSIGWGSVLTSLPTTPWFYIIFLMMYFLLPIYEGLIYRKLWGVPFRESISVLVRKRVLNNEVVGYSGEVYLYWWGRKRSGLADRFVFHSIKDNAIMSSLASTTALVLLVGGFLLTGQVALVDIIGDQDPVYILYGLIATAVLGALGFRFRKMIFALPRGTILGLFATHLSRFLVMYTLQVLQYWVVLPEAPLRVWATILVVGTLTTRIPLLPARDLLAISAVLGISGLLDPAGAVTVDRMKAIIAGMLLVRSGLDRVFNFSLFALTSWWDRRRGVLVPEADDVPKTPPPAPEAVPKADEVPTS